MIDFIDSSKAESRQKKDEMGVVETTNGTTDQEVEMKFEDEASS